MDKRDYYDILGIEQTADDKTIKTAYRRLAQKYHPDKNQGDADSEEKFKEAKEAYEVLSDTHDKANYDQFGHSTPNTSDFHSNINEVFKRHFYQQANMPQRGADMLIHVDITLEEAYSGTTKPIKTTVNTTCRVCSGSGAKKGTTPVQCKVCGGSGYRQVEQYNVGVMVTCDNCNMKGVIIKDKCEVCHGVGRIPNNTQLNIKIPSGIDNGGRLRILHEGEGGTNKGPSGHLYVDVMVQPHDVFTREHSDLLCNVNVDYITLTLGGSIEIPTITGKATLTIPEGTMSGQVFKLKGKGMKDHRFGLGDILCKVNTSVPTDLNEDQKTLLLKFAESLTEKNIAVDP